MCSCSPLISNPCRFLHKAPIFLSVRNPNRRFDALFRRSSPVRSLKSSGIAGESQLPSADGDSEEGSPGFDFLDLKRELEVEDRGEDGFEEEEIVLPGVSGRGFMESEEEEEEEEEEEGGRGRILRSRRRMAASGRQMTRRSSLMAKQVISTRSACNVGFVSQIWVDTGPWLVVVVEVRPSILSGESEKYLLEDVCQVGDVILIEDETLADHEVDMVGLDTLVGYSVVTADRYNIGKVRDFNFNINSGAVESLELDPFGMSVIPASLVSTYSIPVEDILEIKSDKIVVHDGALSRMQRLSKGFWDTQASRYSREEIEEFPGFLRRSTREASSRPKSIRRRKIRPRLRQVQDDWDLPMEY